MIALVPSCALMLKHEWPLATPETPAIIRLAAQTYDISEFVVALARDEGLADGLEPLSGGIALHFACHARAQNMGAKDSAIGRAGIRACRTILGR